MDKHFEKYSQHFEQLNLKQRFNDILDSNLDNWGMMNKLKNLKTLLSDQTIFGSSKLQTYPFLIYLACAFFCLISSCIYHWFFPISKTVFKLLHRLDMAGISILIFGSTYAILFYFFYCTPTLFRIYSTLCFIFCFTVFIVSLGEAINKPENCVYKSSMFAGLGLTNIIPIGHLIILSLFSSPENDYLPMGNSLYYLITMAILYLGGVVIFTTKIPERFYPTYFDIWLNSHTIWHVCVFLAALVHFFGISAVYALRLNKPCIN